MHNTHANHQKMTKNELSRVKENKILFFFTKSNKKCFIFSSFRL